MKHKLILTAVLCLMLAACGKIEDKPANKAAATVRDKLTTDEQVTGDEDSSDELTTDEETESREEQAKQEQKTEDYSSKYTLTLNDDYSVTRTSGEYDHIGSLSWVIEADGEVIRQSNAENMFSFSYSPIEPGVKYSVYLKAALDGGYKTVSNTVEFWAQPIETQQEQTETDPLPVTDWEVINDRKRDMMFLGQMAFVNDRPCDYIMGFVCDPDHDSYYNSVVYYVGEDEQGRLVQYVSDNNTSDIHFSNADDPDNIHLFIWFDKGTHKDYICQMTTDVNDVYVTDIITGELLWSLTDQGYTLFGENVSADEFTQYGFFEDAYSYYLGAESVRDHFIVSVFQKAVEQ